MHPNSINNIVDVSNLDDRAETREERERRRDENEKNFSNICYQLLKMCSEKTRIVLKVFKVSPLRILKAKIMQERSEGGRR